MRKKLKMCDGLERVTAYEKIYGLIPRFTMIPAIEDLNLSEISIVEPPIFIHEYDYDTVSVMTENDNNSSDDISVVVDSGPVIEGDKTGDKTGNTTSILETVEVIVPFDDEVTRIMERYNGGRLLWDEDKRLGELTFEQIYDDRDYVHGELNEGFIGGEDIICRSCGDAECDGDCDCGLLPCGCIDLCRCERYYT